MVVGFVGMNTLMAPATPPVTGAVEAPAASPSVPVPTPSGPAASPTGSVDGVATVPAADRRSYASGLQDLPGLPPDAAPGARLELWVTWEPPVTREPRLQKLIGDVVLDRTIPGSVPEAPVTVLVSIPADRTGDLIYADGYGRLSVVLPE